MNNVVVGHLIVFKGEDEVLNESRIIEVTEFWKSGIVEMAFDDRGERVYVQFPLSDLLTMVARSYGTNG